MALGPATTISLSQTINAVNGNLIITAFMNVTDATPGELVQFGLNVGLSTVLSSNSIADANGYASASFTFLSPTAGGVVSIAVFATAAHNLTSSAGHNSLVITQLPG
jgi:hypothetical protein